MIIRLEIQNVRAINGNPSRIMVELRSDWETQRTDLDLETETDHGYPSDKYNAGRLDVINHELAENEETRQKNIQKICLRQKRKLWKP
jgi:hypothetical protein